MRIGNNPHKDKPHDESEYLHQVIIPVYIPNQEGYFKDSLKIFQLCLQSLFNTIHSKTFITIINNGSCDDVKVILDKLYDQNKIHEVIHTTNIGKLNAIFKGLAGNNIELVTISDADVLFLTGWQNETITIYNQLPKVGVVGIVPQFKLFKVNSANLIVDNLFNKRLQFLPVKNKEALIRFYDSIGWKRDYNHDLLDYILALKVNSNLNIVVGSGHFVATYKKDIFDNIITYLGYKLGGYTEDYLDVMPLKKDYWRVTTYDNYAYHMGNVFESWMEENVNNQKVNNEEINTSNFPKQHYISKFKYIIKIKIFNKIFAINKVYKLFLKWKKLPIKLIKNY